MEPRIITFVALLLFVSGCKKEENVDPEETTKSYITYSIDGKKYHIEHGSENQYVSYFFGEEQNDLFGYKLAVAGRDSTGKIPSFLFSIRNGSPVIKGAWIKSVDFPPTNDVLLSWTHTVSQEPRIYRSYWSVFYAIVEVTELTDTKIKGVFSGTIQTDPNSYFPKESFIVTDGKFLVNRKPSYSVRDPF